MLGALVCALLAPEPSRPERSYARRRPEQSALHLVVRDNLLTIFAAIEQGFASSLPDFVQSELEGYVNCGVLARCFAQLVCPERGEQKLVAFSCDGRGFCPSCLGRRMLRRPIRTWRSRGQLWLQSASYAPIALDPDRYSRAEVDYSYRGDTAVIATVGGLAAAFGLLVIVGAGGK